MSASVSLTGEPQRDVPPATPRPVPELRKELLKLMEYDQAVRFRLSGSGPAEAASAAEQIQDLDRRHAARMKEIVDQYGWPTFSLVGQPAAHAACVLLGAADHDVPFQRRCLELMTEAVERKEASRSDLAHVIDRVLVNEGKPQLYGTQLYVADGKIQPRTIEDPRRVNERRTEMELPVLEEYKKFKK